MKNGQKHYPPLGTFGFFKDNDDLVLVASNPFIGQTWLISWLKIHSTPSLSCSTPKLCPFLFPLH